MSRSCTLACGTCTADPKGDKMPGTGWLSRDSLPWSAYSLVCFLFLFSLLHLGSSFVVRRCSLTHFFLMEAVKKMPSATSRAPPLVAKSSGTRTDPAVGLVLKPPTTGNFMGSY